MNVCVIKQSEVLCFLKYKDQMFVRWKKQHNLGFKYNHTYNKGLWILTQQLTSSALYNKWTCIEK